MSKKIYNNQNGIFRDVEEHEDLALLQDYEVVVNRLPKSDCNKCYGRGYIGKDLIRRELVMCRKCFRKITDFDHARERVKKQMEASAMAAAAANGITVVDDEPTEKASYM